MRSTTDCLWAATMISIALTCSAPAAQGQTFEIPWYTIDGGGGFSAGENFQMQGTIGQHDASEPMTGGNFVLTGGFWAATTVQDPVLLGDVNLDGVVNLLDVAPFVDRIATGTYQAEADVNQDGSVNLLDVDPFIDVLAGG